MNKQKYAKGDHVQVAKDLGEHMSHFESNCEAIVMYTYYERYGGDDIDSYCLHIKNKGESSWYEEHQLTLIEKDRLDLLDEWIEEEKQEEKRYPKDIEDYKHNPIRFAETLLKSSKSKLVLLPFQKKVLEAFASKNDYLEKLAKTPIKRSDRYQGKIDYLKD